MSPVYSWKHWHFGSVEGWIAECEFAMRSLAAEIWCERGEWNWTVYSGPSEFPGGPAHSAEEAKSAVQQRFVELIH